MNILKALAETNQLPPSLSIALDTAVRYDHQALQFCCGAAE
jgi:hypothetical protein